MVSEVFDLRFVEIKPFLRENEKNLSLQLTVSQVEVKKPK